MSWRDRTVFGVKLADFLNWSGRANRLQFFRRYLIICVVGALLGVMIVLPVLWFEDAASMQPTASAIAIALHSVVLAALLVLVSAPISQRTHDLGVSARVPFVVYGIIIVLLAADFLAWPYSLIPDFVTGAVAAVGAVLNLFLLFAKGQPRTNRYGSPP